MTNILILSVGTRNKIIQYFCQTIGRDGKIIATDMQIVAPAIYEADKYYIVPPISSPNYINVILEICKNEKISGILSLIDPELSILAKNSKKFLEIGTTVIGSSLELCERALDKMKMFKWLTKHGYRCAKSYTDKNDFYDDLEKKRISYPVFVKPVCGSASISIHKVNDNDTLENLFSHNENLMIQEYLNGQEIGADCYIDMLSGELISIFTKKKLRMKSGETDKAISFKEKKLFELIKQFVKESGWRGEIDIDMFKIGGEYYISEVNPRFGGGYPHAYECGLNHIKMIKNNLNGISNEKRIGCYNEGIYMMKYNEVLVRKF